MVMVAAGTGSRRPERLRQQGTTAPGAGDDSGGQYQCQRAGDRSQRDVAPAMTLQLDFWTAMLTRYPGLRPCLFACCTIVPSRMDGPKEPRHARYRD